MTSNEPSDDALAETAAGAVQGGGAQDGAGGSEPVGSASEADTEDFSVDHDADPPEEVQPTTS